MTGGTVLLEANQDLTGGIMSQNKPPSALDELINAYELLTEVLESAPSKSYIALMSKTKSMESKPPVNLKLLDRKSAIDWKIRRLTEEILRIIGFQ